VGLDCYGGKKSSYPRENGTLNKAVYNTCLGVKYNSSYLGSIFQR